MVDYFQAGLDLVSSPVADSTRRAILGTIAVTSATVTEIARPFPISVNAISKHLMVVVRAGLIRREIIERKLYCALEAPPLPQASAWLEHYGRFWELRLDKLEEFLVGKQQNSAATVLGDKT